MFSQTGCLGSQEDMASLDYQAVLHEIGDLAPAASAAGLAGAAGGSAKPRGGQNTSTTAGRAARNSNQAENSDAVADNNASASPPAISDPNQAGTVVCEECKEKLGRRFRRTFQGWNQSNCASDQMALGSYVPPLALGFFEEEDNDLNTHFEVPTQVRRFGLVKACHPTGEQVRFEGDEAYREWVVGGAYESSPSHYSFAIAGFPLKPAPSGDPNWRYDFEIDLAQPIPSNLLRWVAKLFYGQIGRWCNLIPHPDHADPACYSARRKNGGESAVSSLGKPACGASFHCFLVADRHYPAIEADARLYAVLPFLDMDENTEIVFLLQDIETGELGPAVALSLSDLESDSSFEVTPLGHEVSTPIAWYQDTALVFSSSQAEDESSIRYTAFRCAPDTVEILNRINVTEEAVSNPTVLEGLSFLNEAATLSYNGTTYNGGYRGDAFDAFYSYGLYPVGGPFSHGTWVRSQIEIASTSKSEFASFQGLTYVQLPAETPNLSRFGTLAGQDATNWPPIKNSGNSTVDSLGCEWRTILRPIQRLYGGHFTTVTTEDVFPTWQEFHQIHSDLCGWHPFQETGHFVKEDPGPFTRPYGHSEECGDKYEDVWYNYVGLQKEKVATWNLDLIILWETWLQCTDLYTGVIWETNISQLFTVTGAVNIAGNSMNMVYGEEENVPAADNVHQVISLPEIARVLVLRDLHVDGASGNPSPALEIYDSSGGFADMPLQTTIPLGTQDLLSSNSGDLKAGDRVWDAYWQGPPRIKGCLCADEHADPSPQFLVAIWERNKLLSQGRAVYHHINLSDPSNPVVTTEMKTGTTLFDIDTNYPRWDEWDSVVLTDGSVAWLNSWSKVQETVARNL